jgi:diaminopimelate epimerase
MLPLLFRKYHGLGNDFILLDGLTRPLPVDHLVDPSIARRLCDRHRGVGADGLLLLLPPISAEAHAQMRIINADGSEAEMCGNGIRCAAAALHDHIVEHRGRTLLSFDTGAGLLRCELTFSPEGLVNAVRVDMGRPVVEGPVELDDPTLASLDNLLRIHLIEDLTASTLRPVAVSMGNPHLIMFPQTDHDLRDLATALGPALERAPSAPNRTNVEFARWHESELELWVWERGCGITEACGTGACATAVAAVVAGRHPAGAPLRICLPGGTLTVEVADDLSRVSMTGPVAEVFLGEVEIPIPCGADAR